MFKGSFAKRVGGLLSWVAAAFWDRFAAAFWKATEWVLDKWLGDAAFAALRSMTAPLFEHDWARFAWDYGPQATLILLGCYLFWRSGRSNRTPADKPPDLADAYLSIDYETVRPPTEW